MSGKLGNWVVPSCPLELKHGLAVQRQLCQLLIRHIRYELPRAPAISPLSLVQAGLPPKVNVMPNSWRPNQAGEPFWSTPATAFGSPAAAAGDKARFTRLMIWPAMLCYEGAIRWQGGELPPEKENENIEQRRTKRALFLSTPFGPWVPVRQNSAGHSSLAVMKVVTQAVTEHEDQIALRRAAYEIRNSGT